MSSMGHGPRKRAGAGATAVNVKADQTARRRHTSCLEGLDDRGGFGKESQDSDSVCDGSR